jgi:cupin fold WbuC family metalloprotein
MSKVTIISAHLLNSLSSQAKALPRLRKNYNFHALYSDPINRMLNAFELQTYCQPHKHEEPDKREVFIVLKGKLGVVIFDDEGNVIQGIQLSPFPGDCGVEIPARVWHMAIALEPGTVAYEIKDGPYEQPLDKNFASWSPREGDSSCENYLAEVMVNAGFSV